MISFQSNRRIMIKVIKYKLVKSNNKSKYLCMCENLLIIILILLLDMKGLHGIIAPSVDSYWISRL